MLAKFRQRDERKLSDTVLVLCAPSGFSFLLENLIYEKYAIVLTGAKQRWCSAPVISGHETTSCGHSGIFVYVEVFTFSLLRSLFNT